MKNVISDVCFDSIYAVIQDNYKPVIFYKTYNRGGEEEGGKILRIETAYFYPKNCSIILS